MHAFSALYCIFQVLTMEQNIITVKLGYNDHGYNEFTAITNNANLYLWSQITTLLQKPSRL